MIAQRRPEVCLVAGSNWDCPLHQACRRFLSRRRKLCVQEPARCDIPVIVNIIVNLDTLLSSWFRYIVSLRVSFVLSSCLTSHTLSMLVAQGPLIAPPCDLSTHCAVIPTIAIPTSSTLVCYIPAQACILFSRRSAPSAPHAPFSSRPIYRPISPSFTTLHACTLASSCGAGGPTSCCLCLI